MTRRAAALLAVVVLVLTGCAGGGDSAAPGQAPSPSDSESAPRPPATPAPDDASGHASAHASGHTSGHTSGHADPTPDPAPLRPGERRATLAMPSSYTPSAPTGVGTDDYRCFLLDPGLERDAWLTGTHVLPGNPDVVHHVILFRVPPAQVAQAEAADDAEPGEGWTCFGGTGVAGELQSLDDAAWLGAWAPGGGESVTRPGYGVRLDAGSRVIMQVHYNLLAGAAPDVSATQLRLRPAEGRGAADLTPLHTYLMPAPVELPCRPGRDSGRLCDRDAAVEDAKARFGVGPGQTANLLHLLCGSDSAPGPVQSCTRTVERPMTVLGAAGHMHLLGRRIVLEVASGTPRARTVLDVPVWDFDDQGAVPVDPVRLRRGDTVRVTCEHDQSLRDRLPAFAGQQEKYVVWGEGTTDEMCLGMLQVSFGGRG